MRIEYFQLIDRIAALSLDDKTIGVEATVPTESSIFEGHFPGYPLMPGVLLIETMAQTCGWLVIALTNFDRMPFLAQVKEARLRTFVAPGQVLSVEGRLLHEGSGYAVARAAIRVDGKAVADGELMFRVMPFPSPDFRAMMRDNAARLGFEELGLALGSPD